MLKEELVKRQKAIKAELKKERKPVKTYLKTIKDTVIEIVTREYINTDAFIEDILSSFSLSEINGGFKKILINLTDTEVKIGHQLHIHIGKYHSEFDFYPYDMLSGELGRNYIVECVKQWKTDLLEKLGQAVCDRLNNEGITAISGHYEEAEGYCVIRFNWDDSRERDGASYTHGLVEKFENYLWSNDFATYLYNRFAENPLHDEASISDEIDDCLDSNFNILYNFAGFEWCEDIYFTNILQPEELLSLFQFIRHAMIAVLEKWMTYHDYSILKHNHDIIIRKK